MAPQTKWMRPQRGVPFDTKQKYFLYRDGKIYAGYFAYYDNRGSSFWYIDGGTIKNPRVADYFAPIPPEYGAPTVEQEKELLPAFDLKLIAQGPHHVDPYDGEVHWRPEEDPTTDDRGFDNNVEEESDVPSEIVVDLSQVQNNTE